MSKHHGHGQKHGDSTQTASPEASVAAPPSAHDAAQEHSLTAAPEAPVTRTPPIVIVENLVEEAETKVEAVAAEYLPAWKTWILKNPLLAVGAAFLAGYVAMRITRR